MSSRRSSATGRRAIVRWAWRLFRREWRQQLLVLGLITLAVAAAVGFSAMATNGDTQGKDRFGNAGGLIEIDAENPALAQTEVQAATRRFGAVEVVGHEMVPVPGSTRRLDFRSQQPNGRFSSPTLALRSGRYPQSAAEIALSTGAAQTLGAHIGSTLDLGRTTRTVVGIVENPADLHDDFGLLNAADTAHVNSLTVLIRSTRVPPPSDGPPATGDLPPFRVEGAPHDSGPVAASVIVIATFAMALVALVAAAGFLVIAQRRQRQFGMLSAIGATERQVRLVTLANGVIVGVNAAIGGAVIGSLGWVVASPAVETAVGHRLDAWNLPWTLVVSCMALALLASTAAAWWPARLMARQPTMAALSRRPAPPSPVHRSLTLSAVLIGAGVASIITAHPTGETVRPIFLLSGLALTIVGVVLVAPAVLRLLAAPAGRLPLTVRLALRDLVRYQARAAAAIAAITLGLSASVTIIVLAQANVYKSDEGNLSSRQMLVHIVSGPDPASVGPILSEQANAAHDADAARIAATIPGSQVLALDLALNPATAGDAKLREAVMAAKPLGGQGFRHGWRFVAPAYVATPQVLAALGIDPSSVDPTADLLTSKTGNITLLDATARGDTNVHVQRIALGKFTSAPVALITQHAMTTQGWASTRSGWLISAPHAITAAETAAAQRIAAGSGFEVEVRSGQDDLATLRTGASVVGILLALAIIAMTMGLLRGESAADVRTLTATGASASARRALTASTAGALATAGVLLAVGGSYGALVAGYHADLNKLVPLPWPQLLLVALCLPLLAVAGGWLLSGREPKVVVRQLTE